MAKSRWQIENEGFNDCKSRQGFEHICHHHLNSLLISWLLTLLALLILRLFRLRHLHRVPLIPVEDVKFANDPWVYEKEIGPDAGYPTSSRFLNDAGQFHDVAASP